MTLFDKGMDPSAVRVSAHHLEQQAGELGTITSSCSLALARMGRQWGGSDAESMQQAWHRAEGHLTRIEGSLHALVATLRAQIGEQDSTSADRGSASGPHQGGPGAGGGAAATSGPVDRPPAPISDALKGTQHHAIDNELADLAGQSYGHPTEPVHGWRPTEVIDGAHGFHAVIWEKDGNYVVGFAGTQPMDGWSIGYGWQGIRIGFPPDVTTDAAQALGLPTSQYRQAMSLAQRVSAEHPGHVAYTGHSMGGGEAAIASVVTGDPAVTFNAAGVHQNTISEAIGRGLIGAGEQSGQIRAYHMAEDPLTTAQTAARALPDALGTQINVPSQTSPDVHPNPWANLIPIYGDFREAKDNFTMSLWLYEQHESGTIADALDAEYPSYVGEAIGKSAWEPATVSTPGGGGGAW